MTENQTKPIAAGDTVEILSNVYTREGADLSDHGEVVGVNDHPGVSFPYDVLVTVDGEEKVLPFHPLEIQLETDEAAE